MVTRFLCGLFFGRIRDRHVVRLWDRFAVGVDGGVSEGDAQFVDEFVRVLQAVGHLVQRGIGDVLIGQVGLPKTVSAHQADGAFATAGCQRAATPLEQQESLVGEAVKPGLLGSMPSLTDLDQGDLKFTVDFRCVYAALLEDWLGADAKGVLGRSYRKARVLRS